MPLSAATRVLLVLVVLLWNPFRLGAQNTTRDYSSEAYVVEQSSARWTFENDGTSTNENTVRIRIQSDAGVERWGTLILPYQKASETLEIRYVRVRKPDGTVVPTPLDVIQDMPAEVTREAPLYSDIREKQIPVKGLRSGDILEYQGFWNTNKPLVPGQFWMDFDFSDEEIVLNQSLQVSVPRRRAVKFKSPGLAPVVSEEGERRIFTWTRSNLEIHHRPKAELGHLAIHGIFPASNVLLSSFQSWEEVGRWYDSLQRERVVPNDEIRAKAAELTRNASDEAAKIQAIYKYVSTEYRYIGVDFGIGRYQPHSAAEVLSNQYGDCKDKHTLLASLLSAAGIPAYPALINSAHVVDPDVPLPAQFDHVITVVPRGKNLLWLDTTEEIAPQGYLVTALRGKPALIITPEKAAFQTTPADPPFPSSWTFKIAAKIDTSGTLEGKVEETLRGDTEMEWRAALRSLPRAKWKDLIQRISYGMGFGGDVSEVSASAPEDTEKPLHVSYSYRRKDYPDWPHHQITLPAPFILLAPSEEDGKLPDTLWLGAPQEIQVESRVELPSDYSPEVPRDKDLEQTFAEYHASYGVEGDVVIGRFHVVTKNAELSGASVKDYETFARKAFEDRNQFIPLFSGGGRSPIQSMNSLMRRVWDLPASDNPQAVQAEEEAREAVARGAFEESAEALRRALEQDPKFTRDWLVLGSLYMSRGDSDRGIETLHKAVDSAPQQPLPYEMLALALMSTKRRPEAIQVWQDLAKVAPDERDIPGNLGTLLVEQKRYGEAIPYFEAAVKLSPRNSGIVLGLANAYLQNHDDEKATATFAKVLEIAPGAQTKNNIAYQLAVANKRLDDALHYAQEAVKEEEDASRRVQLSTLSVDDLKHPRSLSAYWDTLGWVYFQQGNLTKAESYLYAAWKLSQSPTTGYHLAQAYDRQERKPEALAVYRILAVQHSSNPEDQEAIHEATKRAGSIVPFPTVRYGNVISLDLNGALSHERTVQLPKLAKQASAEFFVTLAPGPKAGNSAATRPPVSRTGVVEDTRFISGSELLRSAGKTLSQAQFKVVFPEDSTGRLLRRGILNCWPITGCNFVMLPIETVTRIE